MIITILVTSIITACNVDNTSTAKKDIQFGTKEFADNLLLQAEESSLTTRANTYSQIAIGTYLKLIYENGIKLQKAQ